MEHPIEMDYLEVPPFSETPKFLRTWKLDKCQTYAGHLPQFPARKKKLSGRSSFDVKAYQVVWLEFQGSSTWKCILSVNGLNSTPS